MSLNPRLTLAYIKKRPESAGRVLATLPPADSAAFLSEIPTRYAVQAIAHIDARPAAMIITEMGVTPGVALLRDLGFTQATKILRQIDPATRRQILVELPRGLRRDFELSLAFPATAVGAHMSTAIATLGKYDDTERAIELARQAEREHVEVVFILDDNRELVGAVTVAKLLRHPPRTPLIELLDTSCVALPAHARLDSVAALEAWHDYSCLPVVTRRGQVIGMLPRKSLRLVTGAAHTAAESGPPALIPSMLSAFVASAAGLFSLLSESSDSSRAGRNLHER